MENNSIVLNPIGEVVSDIEDKISMPITGQISAIKIYPEFADALHLIGENSHLWVLSWFHQADRQALRVAPFRIDRDLPERGVFGLRCFNRPNPIALSLVGLIKVDGLMLYVSGLDAINGTPVVDIKPYFEQDIVFSPRTPYLRPKDDDMRREMFFKETEKQHQEDCVWVQIGISMAMIADEHFGYLQSPDLRVKVLGPPCLADIIQGLTRARFSNPPRFEFKEAPKRAEVIWTKESRALKTRLEKMPNTNRPMRLDEIDGLVIKSEIMS